MCAPFLFLQILKGGTVLIVDNALKAKLVEKYKDEQVYVVPFESVKHIEDKFSAIDTKDNSLKQLAKYDNLGKFILRHDAEYNPIFQQLIPYVLIADPLGEKFYVSKRIAGDQRLIKNLSLGFGGHINPCDGPTNVILNAFRRELQEEVDIKLHDDKIHFIGHVRDLTSSTPDHLGFVFVVKADKVRIKESHVLEGQWMTLKELEDNYFNFESWAKYIIDYLYLRKNIF